MDQAESSPSPEPGQPAPDQPDRPARPARPDPRPDPHAQHEVPALRFEHPVVAGYDGSASSRNALAYAAGLSLRLGRPLLIVYVCSSGVYCEPLTGQVVGVPRDADALERENNPRQRDKNSYARENNRPHDGCLSWPRNGRCPLPTRTRSLAGSA